MSNSVLYEYMEYAPNKFKIKCNFDYFINEIDHSILNDTHYFIHITPDKTINNMNHGFIPMVCIVWSNSHKTSEERPFVLPLLDIQFGKDSTITIDSLYSDLIPSFEAAKFWQIEIISMIHGTYIITAPKKPKIITE